MRNYILAASLLIGCGYAERDEKTAQIENDQNYAEVNRQFIRNIVNYCPVDNYGKPTIGINKDMYAYTNRCFDNNSDGIIDLVQSINGYSGSAECVTPDGESYYGEVPGTNKRCNDLKFPEEEN